MPFILSRKIIGKEMGFIGIPVVVSMVNTVDYEFTANDDWIIIIRYYRFDYKTVFNNNNNNLF